MNLWWNYLRDPVEIKMIITRAELDVLLILRIKYWRSWFIIITLTFFFKFNPWRNDTKWFITSYSRMTDPDKITIQTIDNSTDYEIFNTALFYCYPNCRLIREKSCKNRMIWWNLLLMLDKWSSLFRIIYKLLMFSFNFELRWSS